MRLYIANATRQHQIISYRPDIFSGTGFTPPNSIPIKPGRQEPIGGDLAEGQVDEIVKQLRPYGLLWEMEVPRELYGLCPYIANVNQPVSEKVIRTVLDHNNSVKQTEGSRRRERAAIGANEALKMATSQADLPEPPEFDVEFEQMEDSEDGGKRLEEGFHVMKDIRNIPPEKVKAKRPVGRPRKPVGVA